MKDEIDDKDFILILIPIFMKSYLKCVTKCKDVAPKKAHLFEGLFLELSPFQHGCLADGGSGNKKKTTTNYQQ